MSISLERYVKSLKTGLASHDKPEILVLTCMDYRYAHRIVDVLDQEGLRLKYDMFVLAGSSLGGNPGEGNTNKVPDAWRESLVTHIQAARAIDHPIKKVFILEHRQCGAYKFFLDLDWEKVYPGDELQVHMLQVNKLTEYLKTVFPDIEVDALLLTREEDDELCRNC